MPASALTGMNRIVIRATGLYGTSERVFTRVGPHTWRSVTGKLYDGRKLMHLIRHAEQVDANSTITYSRQA
jgi:hypothetical protein